MLANGILIVLQPVLKKLSERAHGSMFDYHSAAAGTATPSRLSPSDDDDELAVLGGRTRLVRVEKPASPSARGSLSDRSCSPIEPPLHTTTSIPETRMEIVPDMFQAPQPVMHSYWQQGSADYSQSTETPSSVPSLAARQSFEQPLPFNFYQDSWSQNVFPPFQPYSGHLQSGTATPSGSDSPDTSWQSFIAQFNTG